MGGAGQLAAPDTGVFYSLRHLIETLWLCCPSLDGAFIRRCFYRRGLRLETYSAKTGRPQSEKLD